MGDIGDQHLVLRVVSDLLLLCLLQANPHLFEGLHQLSEFILRLRLQRKVQISGFDPLRRPLELIHRLHDAHIDPQNEKESREHKDQDPGA